MLDHGSGYLELTAFLAEFNAGISVVLAIAVGDT
jgi:hypothetical protein